MGYAHPEVLVSTAWVEEHLEDPSLRILEVDEDILLYDTGHIPGAQKIDWQRDFWDEVVRDFIDEEGFARLMERLGISNDTTVVLYGDKNNWWAAYAFWFFKYNGHADVRLMNGGRQKWLEEGRPLTTEVPAYPPGRYQVPYRDESIRAYRDDVLEHILKVKEGKGALGGRAEPRGVPWGAHPHAQLPPGGGAPRRPHPRGQEHPLGQGGEPWTAPSKAPRSSRPSTSPWA
jgi:thiosulfate/3-mercaptopyruvate sulfurtransferase